MPSIIPKHTNIFLFHDKIGLCHSATELANETRNHTLYQADQDKNPITPKSKVHQVYIYISRVASISWPQAACLTAATLQKWEKSVEGETEVI